MLRNQHGFFLGNNSSNGGYSDWYLPSQDELNLIYQNKSIVDATSIANGGSALFTQFFWSSSEATNSNSIRQSFNTGLIDLRFKSNVYAVRAVRSF